MLLQYVQVLMRKLCTATLSLWFLLSAVLIHNYHPSLQFLCFAFLWKNYLNSFPTLMIFCSFLYFFNPLFQTGLIHM
jgi:hypothetical protein